MPASASPAIGTPPSSDTGVVTPAARIPSSAWYPAWSTWIHSAAAQRARSVAPGTIGLVSPGYGASARVPLERSTRTALSGDRPPSASPSTSTPSRARSSRIQRPVSSSPTRPTNATGTPSRARATAAVAATPPPPIEPAMPGTRSSGPGMRSTATIASSVATPMHTTRATVTSRRPGCVGSPRRPRYAGRTVPRPVRRSLPARRQGRARWRR